MGRKIPGKKHRGVKDPYEQQARRDEKISKLINVPPSDPDDQDLPKSVLRLAKLRELAKQKAVPKPRKEELKFKVQKVYSKRNSLPPGCTKPEKPVAPLTRFPGETDKHFVFRAHLACQEAIAEVKFENKYGVCVERDAETGAVTGVKKRMKDEYDTFLDNKVKGRKKTNKSEVVSNDGLSKKERHKIKMKEKKKVKTEKKIDEFEKYKDEVKFGEVVHQPPTLRTPRKAIRVDTVARPGKKSLLLTEMLQPKNVAKTISSGNNIPSHVSKLHAEERRKNVVEAYRQIKAQKRGL